MLITAWNKRQDRQEGIGRMFHGNFWSNIEIDMTTGQLIEKENLLPTRESLYRMTDPDWMYENLKDDLALQLALYLQGMISDIDIKKMKELGKHLNVELKTSDEETLKRSISHLLDQYSFAATKYILNKTREFTEKRNKKLMIVLFNPYDVLRDLLKGRPRYDQDIIKFLQKEKFNYFDMNLVLVFLDCSQRLLQLICG